MLSRPSYNNIILCLCTYLFSRRPAECYIDWRTVVKRRSGRIVRRLIDRVVRWGYSKREKHKRFREQIRRIKRDKKKKKKVTASGGGNIRPARASLCFRLMDWNKKRRWQLHSGAIDLFLFSLPSPPKVLYTYCVVVVWQLELIWRKKRERKKTLQDNGRATSEKGRKLESEQIREGIPVREVYRQSINTLGRRIVVVRKVSKPSIYRTPRWKTVVGVKQKGCRKRYSTLIYFQTFRRQC